MAGKEHSIGFWCAKSLWILPACRFVLPQERGNGIATFQDDAVTCCSLISRRKLRRGYFLLWYVQLSIVFVSVVHRTQMSKANGDDYRHISPGQQLSEDRQRRRKVYACFSGTSPEIDFIPFSDCLCFLRSPFFCYSFIIRNFLFRIAIRKAVFIQSVSVLFTSGKAM